MAVAALNAWRRAVPERCVGNGLAGVGWNIPSSPGVPE